MIVWAFWSLLGVVLAVLTVLVFQPGLVASFLIGFAFGAVCSQIGLHFGRPFERNY